MQPAKRDFTNQALRPFVETLEVGDPIGHANLTLVPLRGEGHGQLDYILAAEAIEAGTLTITEVSESGSVPELLAANEAGSMVLLLDGEELVGAKQNRILNTSVLLPARSKTRIPVSCVEQGRWRHVSARFGSGSYSPARLRARKSRDVSRSYEAVGAAHSDQGAVWDEVACSVRTSGSHSPTMAMHDVVEQRHDSLAGFIAALAHPTRARGIIAAIAGRFAALDLFDSPAALERLWPRLVTGYAMDAITQAHQPDKPRQFTAKGAAALLEHVAEVECRAFPSVGLGEDWRFEAEDILGQALVAEGECVHLCVFPAFAADAPADVSTMAPRISPPSSRRPRRGGDISDDQVTY